MPEAIEVRCPLCKAVGTYEPGRSRAGPSPDPWQPIPCFLTPGCPGRIWPEFG